MSCLLNATLTRDSDATRRVNYIIRDFPGLCTCAPTLLPLHPLFELLVNGTVLMFCRESRRVRHSTRVYRSRVSLPATSEV
jgi:hypothetical protein